MKKKGADGWTVPDPWEYVSLQKKGRGRKRKHKEPGAVEEPETPVDITDLTGEGEDYTVTTQVETKFRLVPCRRIDGWNVEAPINDELVLNALQCSAGVSHATGVAMK